MTRTTRPRTWTVLLAGAGSAALAAILAAAQAPTPPPAAAQVPAGPIDIASVEMGGRVEWVTDEYPPTGSAANLIARTRHDGWSSGQQRFPQEIVFSFFSRQSALVGSVEINPWTSRGYGNAKDVEVWTSTENATDGFARMAAATLKNGNVLQPVMFTPVEAKFVKVRVLSSYATNTFHPTVMSRVKIIEGQRPGYTSILTRNPDLGALAKGVIPTAPSGAAGPLPPPDGQNSCPAPVETRPSRYPQSQQVLLVEGSAGAHRSFVKNPFEPKPALFQPAVGGVTLTRATPEVLAPAALIGEPRIDTLVLAQVCDVKDSISKDFKQALVAWVAAGHKLIIQDSDACHESPDYSFLPYRLKTFNPGASGSRGDAGILEDTSLVSGNKLDPSFINIEAWKKGPNDFGDSAIVTEWDARWCGAMWSKNRFQKNGFALAYAHYGRGLIIYDGYDYDQFTNAMYTKLVAQEVKHPFDPDYLPCSNPLGSFAIATDNALKSQPMAANKTYTYPLSVLGNFGYTGRVTLEASISPADPAVTPKLAATVADLTTVDEATTTLTVTAGAAASLKSKTISVRGRDAAGKSNVLCLALPERTTGSVSVVSLLRQDRPDKKPTKNIEIILDASGSMKALLGKKTRWATAQDVLKDVVSKLPKDFSVGLRAYGHTLPSTNPGTCKDTALVVPVGPLNPANLVAAAGKLAPRGETPLVYSILQTPADLKSVGGGTVILITDGEESCKGDFAAAAKTLKDAGLNLTLSIVGFTLKNAPAQAQLRGLAESTGGHYYGANSGDALARAILLAAVDRLPYRILDATGKEVARGEAGVDEAHELAPGTYRVIVSAADQEIATSVTIAIGQDVQLKASVKGDKVVVER
jgi:hypothetical protein